MSRPTTPLPPALLRRTLPVLLAGALLGLLSACAVGPRYQKPAVEVPARFKEQAGWKVATPSDQVERGQWWQVFHDPVLSELEQQVSLNNLNLAQAEARYRQALALVQSTRAGLLPTVGANAQVTRQQGASARGPAVTSTNHNLALNASWDLDLWGKVRASVEANSASASASLLDLEALKLSVQAQLAQSYFALRAVDAQQALLTQTVADYQKSLTLTQNQYKAGVAARENVVLAETQLQTAQAQAADLGISRAQLEHALALLTGKAPANFSLTPAPLAASVPAIPVSVPASLLERRPDIAAAERRMAASNAQIGVAKAAYYPDLSLSGALGFQSTSFANWLTAPNRSWSLGPTLAQSIFDGGNRQGQTDSAIAAYDGTVASYRQTVLTGLQEVEDNLVALRLLEQESQFTDLALQSAKKSVELTTNQYKAGLVSYLNVIQVQTTALTNERSSIDIQNRRLAATVLLIKALGGGW